MEAWEIKLVTMFIMFLMTIICGNIPIRLKSFKENPKLMSLSSAFAGGLFLSVGLLHILPEAQHSFESYHKETDPESEEEIEHFPWSYFILVISFSLILFIDKVAIGEDHHGHGSSHAHGKDLELN